jgi:hypothetical protein
MALCWLCASVLDIHKGGVGARSPLAISDVMHMQAKGQTAAHKVPDKVHLTATLCLHAQASNLVLVTLLFMMQNWSIIKGRGNLQLNKTFMASWASQQQRNAWQPVEVPVHVFTWSSSSSGAATAAAAAAAAAAPSAYKAARKSASNAVMSSTAAAATAAAAAAAAAAATAADDGGNAEGSWQEVYRFNGRVALVSAMTAAGVNQGQPIS